MEYKVNLDIKQRNLEEENRKLKEELELLQIIHENTIEHGSELENELVDQNEKLDSLQVRMKKYLSPQLYSILLGANADTTINHRRKKLTIFFSDIVNFSKITDSIESEVLSEALNRYLNSMAEIASKWGGTIDKFIGDAVMVFFGDPEYVNDKTHALNCIKMAIDMKNKLSELQDEWKEIGCHHKLKIRMGVNTGYCTVGNFGSNQRMDYTIVGGQVNIAARLESCAEPNSIYISRATYDLVKEEIECEFVENAHVKGIHTPVEIYKCKGKHILSIKDYYKSDKFGFQLNEINFNKHETKKNEVEVIYDAINKAIDYIKENTQ